MSKEEIINSILELESNKDRNINKENEIRRQEFKRFKMVKDLRPIAISLGIKKSSYMKKDLLINSILEFESSKALIIIEKNLEGKSYEYQKIIAIYQGIDLELNEKLLNEFLENQVKRCENCEGTDFEKDEYGTACNDCGVCTGMFGVSSMQSIVREKIPLTQWEQKIKRLKDQNCWIKGGSSSWDWWEEAHK